MLHGNTFAQQTLRTILQSLHQDDNNRPVFLLLTGPKNIGKTTIAQTLAKETLQQFFVQDFLRMQDMTQVLGKKHSIKVGAEKDPEMIDLPDGSMYEDKTIREVTKWLQHSSASGKKVLLLENIERMTISAANAFLKAAEEPLPGRIIIATTTHISHIMPTIVSRAIVVPFHPLSDEEMDMCIEDMDVELPVGQIRQMYKRMAMGRPGVLFALAQLDTSMQTVFLDALQALQAQNSIQEQYTPLLTIYKAWYLTIFLDAWIAQLATQDSVQAKRWIQIKKQLQTNVKVDRLLLSGVLQSNH